MSEPSEEAKQAAAKWWKANKDKPIYDSAEAGYRYGYDAATTKLREENEQLRKVIVDHLAPSAKAALANLHSITIY